MSFDKYIEKLEKKLNEIETSNDLEFLNKKLEFFDRMIIYFSDSDNIFCKTEVTKFKHFKEATESRIKQLK
jgi:hypothetical protein